MKKWGLKYIAGYESIKMAKKENNNWIVPVAQITVLGEDTKYFICIEFNEEKYEIKIGLYELYHSNLDKEFHFIRSYRPFVKRLISREIASFCKAIVNTAWYLENWDSDVCKAYREIREQNPKWIF